MNVWNGDPFRERISPTENSITTRDRGQFRGQSVSETNRDGWLMGQINRKEHREVAVYNGVFEFFFRLRRSCLDCHDTTQRNHQLSITNCKNLKNHGLWKSYRLVVRDPPFQVFCNCENLAIKHHKRDLYYIRIFIFIRYPQVCLL